MSVTVAGIDCGTNSIRLMIVRLHGIINGGVDRDNLEIIVPRIMRVVRLGEGVDVHHEFSKEALERVFAAIDEFSQIISQHKVDAIRFVATSATRDARNRQEFENYIHSKLGIYPDIISGDEEARLSFLGATSVINVSKYQSPFLVVDLGGGSTELVLGGLGKDNCLQVKAEFSMNIGSVRMSERHNLSDAPTQTDIDAAIVDIDKHIEHAARVVPLADVRTIIGVSGTVTTMTAVALGQDVYEQNAVDGVHMPIDNVLEVDERVLRMSRTERDTLTVVHPGRRDVIGAGALVWSRVLEAVRQATAQSGFTVDSYVASEHGLLDGIVLDLARRTEMTRKK
ncbi:Ppx/GppA family phosphatase [Alloscardovia venturai]|uniref:Ppx/GppA family phosphatase n=1 Tax=Alloscardovia venturai TaxID=1769421 RepID=A0ABW2Y5J9_9BIFI